MRKLWIIIGCLLTPGLAAPAPASVDASAAAEARSLTQQESIYRDFLQASSDLWFLLSGINNEAEADAAAPRFTELVHRICLLDEQLSAASTETGLTTEVQAEVQEDAEAAAVAGMLDTLQLRILEAFDDVNAEFLSLSRVHCYGSAALKNAFVESAETGMFSEEALSFLSDDGAPMSEMQSEEELERLQRLEEPDRAVLSALQQVKDAASAKNATETLVQLSRKLHNLIPEQQYLRCTYAERYAAHARKVFDSLSPLLWGIRSELVRIAALPGYDSESYDAFSDALNSVYEDLDATHHVYFDDVFDASFRSDLDDAMQENAAPLTQP